MTTLDIKAALAGAVFLATALFAVAQPTATAELPVDTQAVVEFAAR